MSADALIDQIVDQCLGSPDQGASPPRQQQQLRPPHQQLQRPPPHTPAYEGAQLAPATSTPPPQPNRHEHFAPHEGSRSYHHGAEEYQGPSHHTPLGSARNHQGAAAARGSPEYAGGGGAKGDATLRRIQMWEEKKKIKQMLAKREQAERGLEECTFQPDVNMARNMLAAHKSPTDGRALPEASPPPTAQTLMTPSRLYKDNKAWGFDSFVDRQVYARELKRRQEEDAEAVFALKNPNKALRATVPEPFEFGIKGRREANQLTASPSLNVNHRLRREMPDFYDPSAPTHIHGHEDITAPTIPSGLFSLQASTLVVDGKQGRH